MDEYLDQLKIYKHNGIDFVVNTKYFTIEAAFLPKYTPRKEFNSAIENTALGLEKRWKGGEEID